MSKAAFIACLLSLGGCASVPAPEVHSVAMQAAADESRVVQLVADNEAQGVRLRELEARLALIESESRELRTLVADLSSEVSRRSTNVTANARRARDREFDEEASGESGAYESRDSSRRPVLRIVGEPARSVASSAAVSAPLAPVELPSAPDGVSMRLPVTGPAQGFSGVNVLPISAASSVVAQAADPVASYRAALGFVSAREFSRAHEALSRFLEENATHVYADNALFWRAEVWFLQGEYARAIRDYELLITRFPSGNKAPDALLRIAACHARLGHPDESRAAVERVRRQYPTSEAAQRASQRDAT